MLIWERKGNSVGREIRNRLVPDPSMTDSEYLHQKNLERERAEAKGTEPRLTIGKVWVEENAITRIGALVFIRRREAHHELAAERFKGLYEARYGAGNPIMDPGRIQVDTSPVAHDSGMAAKLDRTWQLDLAKSEMGKEAFDRLVAVLVLEIPAGEGQTSRPRQRCIDRVLSDLDTLSGIWKLSAKVAA